MTGNDEIRMKKEIRIKCRNTLELRATCSTFRLRHFHSSCHCHLSFPASLALLVAALALVVSCSPGKRITKAMWEEVKRNVEEAGGIILGRPTSVPVKISVFEKNDLRLPAG